MKTTLYMDKVLLAKNNSIDLVSPTNAFAYPKLNFWCLEWACVEGVICVMSVVLLYGSLSHKAVVTGFP